MPLLPYKSYELVSDKTPSEIEAAMRSAVAPSGGSSAPAPPHVPSRARLGTARSTFSELLATGTHSFPRFAGISSLPPGEAASPFG
jgi:hypothetical protein